MNGYVFIQSFTVFYLVQEYFKRYILSVPETDLFKCREAYKFSLTNV